MKEEVLTYIETNPLTLLKRRLEGECHPAKQTLMILDRLEKIEKLVLEMIKPEKIVKIDRVKMEKKIVKRLKKEAKEKEATI
jgi:hypothetical protein